MSRRRAAVGGGFEQRPTTTAPQQPATRKNSVRDDTFNSVDSRRGNITLLLCV